MRKFSLHAAFLLCLCTPLFAAAQEPAHDAPKTKKQKQAEKKRQEQISKANQSDIEGRKRQYEIQTKAVRKRMKESKKISERNNKNMGRRWWERIWRRQRTGK